MNGEKRGGRGGGELGYDIKYTVADLREGPPLTLSLPPSFFPPGGRRFTIESGSNTGIAFGAAMIRNRKLWYV